MFVGGLKLRQWKFNMAKTEGKTYHLYIGGKRRVKLSQNNMKDYRQTLFLATVTTSITVAAENSTRS
jgi:hypothetical protein